MKGIVLWIAVGFGMLVFFIYVFRIYVRRTPLQEHDLASHVGTDAEKGTGDNLVCAGLACRKCHSPQIHKLPPSNLTRNPGYSCGSCGLKMVQWKHRVGFAIFALFCFAVAALLPFSAADSAHDRTILDPDAYVRRAIIFSFFALCFGIVGVRETLRPLVLRTGK
jgi:hypothetical protein